MLKKFPTTFLFKLTAVISSIEELVDKVSIFSMMYQWYLNMIYAVALLRQQHKFSGITRVSFLTIYPQIY